MSASVSHPAVVQYVLGLLAVEVGEADVLDESPVHQLLQGAPGHQGADVLIILQKTTMYTLQSCGD